MEQEIYEVEPGRWGFRVGGVVQECLPDAEGYVPMTEEEARHWAAVIAARMGA
jgi:hypothetical protein